MPKKVQRNVPSQGQPIEPANQPSLSIDWNRVCEKTKTDVKRLREYGLPPDTAVFRVVQCSREKATLYGDIDHLGHKERGDLIGLVRDIIEGRPPEDYSPTQSILTSPSRFFLRTRGRLKQVEKREWKGRLTVEELDSKMTVIGAEGMVITDEAADLIAALLWDAAERELENEAAMTRPNM